MRQQVLNDVVFNRIIANDLPLKYLLDVSIGFVFFIRFRGEVSDDYVKKLLERDKRRVLIITVPQVVFSGSPQVEQPVKLLFLDCIEEHLLVKNNFILNRDDAGQLDFLHGHNHS